MTTPMSDSICPQCKGIDNGVPCDSCQGTGRVPANYYDKSQEVGTIRGIGDNSFAVPASPTPVSGDEELPDPQHDQAYFDAIEAIGGLDNVLILMSELQRRFAAGEVNNARRITVKFIAREISRHDQAKYEAVLAEIGLDLELWQPKTGSDGLNNHLAVTLEAQKRAVNAEKQRLRSALARVYGRKDKEE